MVSLWRLKKRRWRVVAMGFVLFAFFGLAVLVKEPKFAFEQYSDVMIPLKSKHRNQEEYIDRRGIHVVVGHYIGDDIPGKIPPNLTDEILNWNDFEPQRGAGEHGFPVQIPSFEMKKMQLLYNVNKFNLLASNRIALNRTLPDMRKKACQQRPYKTSLPTTSVIIVFHNEAWSTLLRTVHSVINRSPHHLIKEIILVDDASERTFLKEALVEHVSQLPVAVKVLRTGKRVGLIRSRLLGADQALGQILTFLDAHCETTDGWLVPLLARVAEDKTKVVCPIIDIIDENTFQYIRSFALHWGAFNWNLHYRWFTLGKQEMGQLKKDPTEPYKTPAMAGGLFSIDKEFFYSIGSYDAQMSIWGGENLEMSFRVWMCGGSVETVPCSHVGHVFRKSSPYTFPGEGGVGGILYRNLARVALVWMDEWSHFYFKMNPEAERASRNVSVVDRKLLRKRLQCKTFQWYLDNIWTSHFLPTHDGFYGKIQHTYAKKCLQRPQSPGSAHPIGVAALKDCVIETYSPQTFVFNKKGFIMSDESVCVDAPDVSHAKEPQVRIMPCTENQRQRWTYDEKSQQIVHISSKLCLDLPTKDNPETLSLQTCNTWLRSQRWTFQDEDWAGIK